VQKLNQTVTDSKILSVKNLKVYFPSKEQRRVPTNM